VGSPHPSLATKREWKNKKNKVFPTKPLERRGEGTRGGGGGEGRRERRGREVTGRGERGDRSGRELGGGGGKIREWGRGGRAAKNKRD